MQFSRTRLSEEASRFRPRKAARPPSEPDKTKLVVQASFRKPPGRRPCRLVFGTQPPTQPSASMSFQRFVGFANRTKTEVIRPPIHLLIELLDHFRSVPLSRITSSFIADRLTDALH